MSVRLEKCGCVLDGSMVLEHCARHARKSGVLGNGGNPDPVHAIWKGLTALYEGSYPGSDDTKLATRGLAALARLESERNALRAEVERLKATREGATIEGPAEQGSLSPWEVVRELGRQRAQCDALREAVDVLTDENIRLSDEAAALRAEAGADAELKRRATAAVFGREP